jgi:hypothetical protein
VQHAEIFNQQKINSHFLSGLYRVPEGKAVHVTPAADIHIQRANLDQSQKGRAEQGQMEGVPYVPEGAAGPICNFIISGATVLVRTLAASHRRFRNLTPLDELSARRKGLYLYRTIQYRNTKTNMHASSGIRTHDPRNQDLRL